MVIGIKSYVVKDTHIRWHSIQLPPEWLKVNSLGDLLIFYLDENGRLIIELDKAEDEKVMEGEGVSA